MKKIIQWSLVLMTVAGLCGCETVQGVGRDIQNAGSSMERAFSSRR